MIESIGRIRAAIEAVRERALVRQPAARDLHAAAAEVLHAAELAERRIRRMSSPFSIPRLRLYLTLATLLLLSGWIYYHYFEPRPVRVAVTGADSALLRARARRSRVQAVELVAVEGSSAGLQRLSAGAVDATIVQGGVPIPDQLESLGLVRHEHVLYLRRHPHESGTAERVITFGAGQGSHLLGQVFFRQWGIDVTWLHAWQTICDGGDVPDADAVFIVVDPADPAMRHGLHRVLAAGFELTSPSLGAYEEQLGYLAWTPVRAGYYQADPPAPATTLHTYRVANYLVARPALTARQREDVARALVPAAFGEALSTSALHSDGNSVTADLANLFEGVVNFALIMAALLGLEIVLHRRYLQELGALLTRLSLIQADRDVLSVDDPDERRRNVLYLESCSDLLGLVSSIAGYYSQGNAALAFNGLTAPVHVRAHLLKLNIQLKLVQAAEIRAG